MLNRLTVRQMNTEAIAALTPIAAKYGCSVMHKSSRYDDQSNTLTVRFFTGSTEDDARRDFDLYASSFGLSPEDFGKQFTYGGKTFTVCGIKPKADRFPIIATNATGSRFKFPVEALKNTRPSVTERSGGVL